MPLVKEVCQRCINKCKFPWTPNDDARWSGGIIGCPAGGGTFIKVTMDVPPLCPMALEQMVLSQNLILSQEQSQCP